MGTPLVEVAIRLSPGLFIGAVSMPATARARAHAETNTCLIGNRAVGLKAWVGANRFAALRIAELTGRGSGP
jgi:hypothetical protein